MKNSKSKLHIKSLAEATTRIVLNEEDFKKLVIGEVVRKENLAIALSDIGYKLMLEIIEEARENMYNNKT